MGSEIFDKGNGLNEKAGHDQNIQAENGDMFEKNQDGSPSPLHGEIVQERHLSVDKHGMRLHPQPTNDPLDPLNWSKTRKHSILAIVMSL